MNRTSPRRPPRALALVLVVVAIVCLLLPVWYTVQVAHRFGPFGSLIAWTTAAVGVIGTITVLVLVVRHFVKPALDTLAHERNL